MAETLPVSVDVRRADGTTERVRIGSATRQGEGFVLQLAPLVIGTVAMAAPSPSYGGGSDAPRRAPSGAPGDAPSVFPPYGRSKGMPIAGASMQDLEFYANGCKRTLNDPGKSRFHDKERALLATIEAELARQGFGGGPGSSAGRNDGDPGYGEPPPPLDDDGPAPF